MHTLLLPEKVKTVAFAVQSLVDTKFTGVDLQIAEQMINEGIRKINDNAVLMSDDGKQLDYGKFRGHAHWSLKALETVKKNKGRVGTKGLGLLHEHVIPVNVLVYDVLFKNSPGTEIEKYETQIRDLSTVAIITTSEHDLLNKMFQNKMPKGWQKGDFLWDRYVQAGLMNDICSDWAPAFRPLRNAT